MLAIPSIVFWSLTWSTYIFKNIQFQILKLFSPLTEAIVKRVYLNAGIQLNGPNPWDIQVRHKDFYARLATWGSLASGEMYMEGWYECQDLTEMVTRIMKSRTYRILVDIESYLQRYFNFQSKSRAWTVGEAHYDTGNDLFEAMLDSSMNYSCGYWKTAKSLDEAQNDKMALIAKKLMLKPGMKVLDIGCGWGGLAKYLAENCGVSVVGCTISKEQVKWARERCANLPVEFRLIDYRDLNEKFDRVVSVGMFEHVGSTNYRTYMEVAHRCLVDDGIFLLHTIGISHADMPLGETWMTKYIFPNGSLPHQQHITKYTNGLFIIEDWHNFGFDYSKTLQAWLENFEKAWPTLEKSYGKTFYRMWIYYLRSCIGCFISRKINLWQVVLTKDGLPGGYRSPR